MTKRVFVDTNVLVYARDTKEDRKRVQAQQWLTALADAGCLNLNLQVINELTRWILAREPQRSVIDVRREVDALRIWGEAPLTDEEVEIAWSVRSKFGYAWFDCLLIAAARNAGCAYFLTEDMGAKSGATFDTVKLVDPFETSPTTLISPH